MENKFCLKSRQELAEIRQAKEEKKNSMSEISDDLKDNALKARYARLRKANDDHMKAMFRKVNGAEEVNAREKDLESAEKEMETQGKKIDRHLALRRKAQSESVVNENEGTKYRVMILTKENDDVVEYFEYDNESEALKMFNEFAKQLEDGGDDSWAYVLAEYGSDENAWYPLDSTFSESKIDEISDTTAMTAYNKRVGNVQKALKNFKTANTKVNKLFRTVDGAEKRPDIEKAMATREKRAEEFDVADKKMAKMHDLYAKRNARKAQSESLTASKALAMSKAILDEISDELANRALEKTVKETVKSNFSDEAVDKEQKMIKQMILRKKRQGKELDKNEKEFLAKSESMEDDYELLRNKENLTDDEYKKLNDIIFNKRDEYLKAKGLPIVDDGSEVELKDGRTVTIESSEFDINDNFTGYVIYEPDYEVISPDDIVSVIIESKINENDNVKDTMEKLYHFIQIEREMHNAGEWGKDEAKDKAHKQSISDLFDELDKLGVGFGIQNSLVASAQSSNPDFSKWYTENVAKSESVNENESILETIKEDIMNAVKERYGDDPDMLDWIYVDVERREDGYVRVELRAELDYEGMDNLIDYLKPIIKKYDKQAYFDMDSPGIAEAILEVGGIEESLNEELASEHTQEAYDGIENVARAKIKEVAQDNQDKTEIDKAVGDAVVDYIKSIPSDDILNIYLEMGFDEPQLVEPFRPLVEDELISYFNKNIDSWKEIVYDNMAYGESLTAKSVLAKSKELLEGMIDKYGREVDPKEWEEKEAKGLNEVSDELVGKAQRKALDKMKDANLSKEEREKAFKQRFGLDWQKALRGYRKGKQAKSESVVNEISDELVDKAQNKALADVVNPGDEDKKAKGFKHLVNLEKLRQVRDKRKGINPELEAEKKLDQAIEKQVEDEKEDLK